MACVGGPGRLGSVSAGDLLRCSATRGAVASKPFLGPWTVHRASRRKRESRKRKFCTRKRSPLHCGGRGMPGDKAPPLGGQMGAVLGVLLRNYGFTDLPPSLPLPRSDPVTRISESSYRRAVLERRGAKGIRTVGQKGCLRSKYGYLGSSRNLSFQGRVGISALGKRVARAEPEGAVELRAPARRRPGPMVPGSSYIQTQTARHLHSEQDSE